MRAGAKGTSQSFVTVTDTALSTAACARSRPTRSISKTARRGMPQYKKQGVKPPIAKAVETLIETGDFHVTTIGDNLPNENEIHAKYGSKSFLFSGSCHALDHATGFGPLSKSSPPRRRRSRWARNTATRPTT